ncbi:hypothetical protein GSI_13162 [Ganoderma sinense ZZ0214-1]|uniref:Uncharacterized protein n=1 Tax=Ganoderma sinense ZZ0214-1 TaxID=1077348 RepID=A0A2G8RUU2_9APHY|nr:hypothetical protein GSI_13162 [Ganoderma sinense ZZ0214-1]
MEMCPSPGLHVDKLGDSADPLPPERKRTYEKKKARIQAARVAAIRSKKDRVEGRRKTVAKKNTTPPPEQPPPLLTVFPTVPAPPVPHLPTAQSTPPEEPRASSSFLSSSRYATRPASADVDETYQPPPTAKNGQNQNAFDSTHYFEFYATPQTGHATPTHIRSSASMPSLESDRGTPSTVQSPPSPYPVAEREGRASAEEEDVDSDELFNTVYQSFFIPRSSWSPPWPALEQAYATAPSVVPKAAHAPCDLMKPVPYFLPYPPPSQPAFMDLLGAHARDSKTIRTAVRTSTHQGGHSGHSYVPAATPSSVIQSQQRRGDPKKGASRTTGTPGLRRSERATFDHQRAPSPYPSHSDRVAGGHALLNRSLATLESSAAAERGCYEVTSPITAAVRTRRAQVQQHDGSALGSHARHDNARHLSTRSSSSHAHTIHTSSIPTAGMISTPLVDSVNHHRLNVPATIDVPQPSQPARTSVSAYSELAHALVHQPPVAAPAMQAGIGAGTVHASLYAPQVRSGAIASSTTNAAGTLAYDAQWPQNDLPIASHPALASSQTHAAVMPETSRAHAANTDDKARTFEGHFEECAPFWPSVIVPLLGMGSATGQSLDGTYLGEPSAGSQSHLRQQFLTTSTWHETHAELSYPYPPSTVLCSTSSFTAAAMQGLRE